MTRGAFQPKCNVYKVDDNLLLVQLQVPGFGKDDLSVEIDRRLPASEFLVIKGTAPEPLPYKSLFAGFMTRSFVHQSPITGRSEIKGVRLENGVLSIKMARLTSDEPDVVRYEIETA